MSAFSLPGVTGVLVLEVPAESPLAKAWLRKNDVILSLNGGKAADTVALLGQVSELPAWNSL
jgi:S1-C subfamily serine protease